MSDVKRFVIYDPHPTTIDDMGEDCEVFVKASDYDALREQCRWAMGRILHGAAYTEEQLQAYERAQAWLAAHREEKA